MKQFNGFEAKKSAGRETLPAGGYIAQIAGIQSASYTWGDVLILHFDITEGPYKQFFAKDYAAQTGEDKKWRGNYRLSIPKDDGSKNDSWIKRTFGNVIWALEESNPGYHFDWDEQKFKGKQVGVLFRNKEWEYEGRKGWTTECCAFTSTSDIRNNTFHMPKDKPLPEKIVSAQTFPGFTEIDDEDSPF